MYLCISHQHILDGHSDIAQVQMNGEDLERTRINVVFLRDGTFLPAAVALIPNKIGLTLF